MIYLYIDPGTGSMLFSILIGVIAALLFVLRKVLLTLKFYLSGGKAVAAAADKLPYVIFSYSKRYWNVFKPICDEFEKRQTVVHYYTASPDDPALDVPYKYVKCSFIGEGNKAFVKLNLLSANICLSTTPGLEVYQWKRSKDIDWYIHMFHAVDEGLGYRMFGMDFYDAVVLTGAFQERYIRILEEKRELPAKETVVVGCDYLDTMAERLAAVAPTAVAEARQTTVLLAPSWGPSAILSTYGEKMIDALLATGFQIIIRPHPQSFVSEKALMDRLTAKYQAEPKLTWNYDNDNFEALQSADVLITDFSGIIFDFTMVFDKPIIYADTQFDAAIYDACWVDEPLWRFQILPQLGIELKEEKLQDLNALINQLLTDDKYKEGRAAIRSQVWQYRGEAAARTVDYMMEKYRALTNE